MDEAPDEESDHSLIEITLDPDEAGDRIDRVLAERAGDLSRARLQALIDQGAVFFGETPVRSGSVKAQAGLYRIEVPAPVSATPQAEDIPLNVLYEDVHLIVIDKPAGMVSHPGPGQETGSLVTRPAAPLRGLSVGDRRGGAAGHCPSAGQGHLRRHGRGQDRRRPPRPVRPVRPPRH